MRRRLATILTAALLGSALLPLTALPVAATDAAVLAAAGAQSTEGPEPMSPDATENEFAPPDYEPNWTWRAGKVLLAAFLGVVLLVALSYYLRVVRPRSRSTQSS